MYWYHVVMSKTPFKNCVWVNSSPQAAVVKGVNCDCKNKHVIFPLLIQKALGELDARTGVMVGRLVGRLVGRRVGRLVGRFVGTLVGALVGRLVGLLVGRLVGRLVGAGEGAGVGARVGTAVGTGVMALLTRLT